MPSSETPVARANDGPPSAIWNEQTFNRCAQLLADGQMSCPEDLTDEQAEQLRIQTRRRRRARLVRFIAGRIAAEWIDPSQSEPSEEPDDQGHV